MSEPIPAPDDLIEKARRVVIETLGNDPFNAGLDVDAADLVEVLNCEGLLAEPALKGEVERLRSYAETTRHHQRQHAEAYRELTKVRAERDQLQAKYERLLGQRDRWWDHVGRERHRIEVERDMLLWLHAEADFFGQDWCRQWLSTRELAGQLQARIDAALAELDRPAPQVSHGGNALWDVQNRHQQHLQLVRAALQGEGDDYPPLKCPHCQETIHAGPGRVTQADVDNHLARCGPAWQFARECAAAALQAEEPKRRCCIGPFRDGTHAANCSQACQDCGGDESGLRRCRCRDDQPTEPSPVDSGEGPARRRSLWRPLPRDLCGSDPERAGVGDPGHCDDCASVGHIVAHPDLGCGDVGCYSDHPDEPATPSTPPGQCPNDPPCEHPAVIHDASGDPEDPAPMCCVEGCQCGQVVGGEPEAVSPVPSTPEEQP